MKEEFPKEPRKKDKIKEKILKEEKGTCRICGKKLSAYNNTGECNSHSVSDLSFDTRFDKAPKSLNNRTQPKNSS